MIDEIRRLFDDSVRVTAAAGEKLAEPIARAVELMVACYRAGGGVFVFGNGGSAADAQHIAGEFVVKLNSERAALPALALTTDASVVTAAANDYGYAEVFTRQIEALCNVNDLVVALSTSGNSPNVVRGLEVARERRVVTAAFLGGDGGEAARHADIPILIPSTNPQRIQELHAVMGHVWVTLVEELVFRGAR